MLQQPATITLMLAEDHGLLRELIAQDLGRYRHLRVIGQAANGQELLDLVKQKEPDIVLLDIRMPVLNGHAVLKAFKESHPAIKTIVLSSEYTGYHITSAILNGAAAFLDKNCGTAELVTAIESVQHEGYYFNDAVSERIVRALNADKKIYYLIAENRFSEREIEVLQQLCSNKAPGQIADALFISPNTVNYHKKNLLKKTESDSMVSLVKYAIRHGIVESGDH